MALFTNVVTEDDFTAWATEGAPTIAAITGPFGITTAYRVTYTSGSDLMRHEVSLPDLSKPIWFVVIIKELSSFSMSLSRTSDLAAIIAFSVLSWTAGNAPSLDVAAGTLEEAERYDGTWWKLVFKQTNMVNADRASEVRFSPPADSSVDVYKVNVFTSSTLPSRLYNAGESAQDGWNSVSEPTTTWNEVAD